MNGREFVRRARRYARRHGLEFDYDLRHGKGSHGTLTIGNRLTRVQHGKIATGTLMSMLRDLDIDRRVIGTMKYAYPCVLEPEEDEKYKGWFNVSFPDIQGALTCGRDWKTAIIMAEDCLVVSLASYVVRQEELPTPSAWAKGQELMTVQPLIAAQLDLYVAMREQGVTTSELAQRLNLPEAEVKRLLSLDYKTSINEVVEALELLGRNPVVDDLAA